VMLRKDVGDKRLKVRNIGRSATSERGNLGGKGGLLKEKEKKTASKRGVGGAPGGEANRSTLHKKNRKRLI